jgi:soluble lytic murein transglycosylase-like protein
MKAVILVLAAMASAATIAIVFRPIIPVTPALAAPIVARTVTLEAHATKAIELSAHKLSPTRKKLIATMISGIAERTFDNREHSEWWITLLAVESGYDGRARSSTGAIGIGQLIASYREDFGKECGFTDVDKDDLSDDYVNATLSACYFKTMIARNDGSVSLALVAYNAGPHSSDLRKAKSGSSPGLEPSQYTTRAVIHKEQVSK